MGGSKMMLRVGLLCVLAFFIGTVAYSVNNQNEEVEQFEQKVADCQVIGEMLDSVKGGQRVVRTIYQCPDGMMRIL
jgi:hypothetical protein